MPNAIQKKSQLRMIHKETLYGVVVVAFPDILTYLLAETMLILLRIGGRQRTDCCKVKKPPPPILQCKTTLCDLDPGACQISAIDAYGSVSKREDTGESIIVKRGSPNNYKWTLFGSTVQILMRSRRYPTPAQHMANVRRQLNGIYQQFFRQRSLRCSNIRTTAQPFPDLNTPPSDGQVEHPVPVSIDTPLTVAWFSKVNCSN